MIAVRTHDKNLIRKAARDISDVADDSLDISAFDPDTEKDCWVDIRDNCKSIGVYCLKPVNDCCLEIHAYILKKYRRKYAGESGKLILKYYVEETPANYQKLITQVPVIYKNVIKFTLRHGFTVEGMNRLSCRKNGVIYDQMMFGITRQEVEDQLNG